MIYAPRLTRSTLHISAYLVYIYVVYTQTPRFHTPICKWDLSTAVDGFALN